MFAHVSSRVMHLFSIFSSRMSVSFMFCLMILSLLPVLGAGAFPLGCCLSPMYKVVVWLVVGVIVMCLFNVLGC